MKTLVRNGFVLPMEGGKVIHDPGSVLFENGVTLAVGPVEVVDADPRGRPSTRRRRGSG